MTGIGYNTGYNVPEIGADLGIRYNNQISLVVNHSQLNWTQQPFPLVVLYCIVSDAYISPNCQNIVPVIVADRVGPNNHLLLQLMG